MRRITPLALILIAACADEPNACERIFECGEAELPESLYDQPLYVQLAALAQICGDEAETERDWNDATDAWETCSPLWDGHTLREDCVVSVCGGE